MNKRLLIAEDEPKMRDAVRIYFTSKGYEVTGAKDGAAALELLGKLLLFRLCKK